MTLSGVIAHILRLFTEFERLGGRCKISSSSYILAETDPRSSRTVSLRRLSLFFILDFRNSATSVGTKKQLDQCSVIISRWSVRMCCDNDAFDVH